jgi:hypothetical protein
MKILLLASRNKDHFIQTVMENMVLGLDPDRFEAKVCYLKGSSAGQNPNHWPWMIPSKLSMTLELIKILREERPHILHCHRGRRQFAQFWPLV